jgi:hypothetical protein
MRASRGNGAGGAAVDDGAGPAGQRSTTGRGRRGAVGGRAGAVAGKGAGAVATEVGGNAYQVDPASPRRLGLTRTP